MTEHNLRLNNLKAQVIEVDVREHLPYRGDLIVANLYKGLILDLLKRADFYSARYYIISGILQSMGEDIEEVLAQAPVRLSKKLERENWACYLLRHV